MPMRHTITDSREDTCRSTVRGLPGLVHWLSMWLTLTLLPVSHADLVTMGDNTHGQTSPPSTLLSRTSDILAVHAGRDHSSVLLSDGSVASWGYAGDGRTSPPADLNDAVTLDAGTFHTLALRRDGTVTGWGFNGAGMLDIPEDLTNVVAVAAGGFHSLALRGDGIVVGWGFDGNNRTKAPASLTDVIKIDAGRDHSIALKSDGSVVAWGVNNDEQATVPEGLMGVVSIASGEFHNLALRSDGSVVAWGRNVSGQSSVPPGLTDVVAISAGGYHSLALRADGTIAAWGDNSSGQLGVANVTAARAISAGGLHSLVVTGRNVVFTSQPKSHSVIAGKDVVFSVVTEGATDPSYQWQRNGIDLPGANSSELLVSNATAGSAGLYSVIVHTPDGWARSAEAVLIVRSLHQLEPIEFLSSSAIRISFGDRHGVPLAIEDLERYQLQSTPDFINWSVRDEELQLHEGRIRLDLTIDPNHTQEFFRVVER